MFREALCIGLLSLSVLATGCGDDDDEGHPDGIGNSCAEDSDCATENCYLGPGGGYCTSECNEEGEDPACPADTVCKPIQGGPARCLLVCGSASACDGDENCASERCPNGSSCVSVDSTEHQACEPDPQ